MALGFAAALPVACLTIVASVGDDDWFHGLRVCPDLDTLVQTLSGRVDANHTRSVAGDSSRALEVLTQLGARDTWMTLGDADIGLHLYRTTRLAEGASLTEVTHEISTAFGVSVRILPVTDGAIRTTVASEGRLFRFLEWYVKHRSRPQVSSLHFEGADTASPSLAVTKAIRDASLIVFAPSNPFLSILPMLSVRGVSESVRSSSAVKVAVSPLINGSAVNGPLIKLMSDLKVRAGNAGIIDFYQGIVQGIAIDSSDRDDRAEIVSKGMRALVTSTRIPLKPLALDLARHILEWSSAMALETNRVGRA